MYVEKSKKHHTLMTCDFPCFQNLGSLSRLSIVSDREEISLDGREVSSFLMASSDEVITLLYLFSMSSFSVVLKNSNIHLQVQVHINLNQFHVR